MGGGGGVALLKAVELELFIIIYVGLCNFKLVKKYKVCLIS